MELQPFMFWKNIIFYHSVVNGLSERTTERDSVKNKELEKHENTQKTSDENIFSEFPVHRK